MSIIHSNPLEMRLAPCSIIFGLLWSTSLLILTSSWSTDLLDLFPSCPARGAFKEKSLEQSRKQEKPTWLCPKLLNQGSIWSLTDPGDKQYIIQSSLTQERNIIKRNLATGHSLLRLNFQNAVYWAAREGCYDNTAVIECFRERSRCECLSAEQHTVFLFISLLCKVWCTQAKYNMMTALVCASLLALLSFLLNSLRTWIWQKKKKDWLEWAVCNIRVFKCMQNVALILNVCREHMCQSKYLFYSAAQASSTVLCTVNLWVKCTVTRGDFHML